MVRWLEANGYDVSYITGVDTDRAAQRCSRTTSAFLSVGHDEYWSGQQRANVEAARNAGVQPGVLQRQRSVLEDALGKQHRRLGHRLPHAGLVQGDARQARRSIRRADVDRHLARSALQPAGRWRPSGECADRHDLHGELRVPRRIVDPGGRRQDAPVARHGRWRASRARRRRRCRTARSATSGIRISTTARARRACSACRTPR